MCLSLHRVLNLRTLDLSKNALTAVSGKFVNLMNLTSINLDKNKLTPGSLVPITSLLKLQKLSIGDNLLGKPTAGASKSDVLPELPKGLKQLKINANFLSHVPRHIMSSHLIKLERLDLSHNQLALIPVDIAKLKQLTELNLDDNVIVSIPQAAGLLKKLKVLSLRNNRISYPSNKNAPPLPASLFTETPLIDLNLHGNPMTSTQLNTMEGFDIFLERRQEVKTSTLMGGALTNLDVCGLE
jgi:Leucine-rich repeat (LRR) protein